MHITARSCRPGFAKLGAFLVLAACFTGCAGTPPGNLGSAAQGLAPCPDSPNCVSSLAKEDRHAIAPLRVAANRERAESAVRQVISNWPRARVTLHEAGYVRSEFTSRLLGFVDDVEFWWADDHTIHVRSASRLGYSDFGVNRERVEALKGRIDEALR